MATISSCGFDGGGFAAEGKALAAQQSKIGLKQALLNAKNATAAAKAAQAAAAKPAIAQPVQQATVPIVQQQPITAQPTPLQIALQSSSFKCDHSCPVISSQPVLVVSQDQVLCTVVVVVPQSAAQTVPSHTSISALPVLLIVGIVTWLVFR